VTTTPPTQESSTHPQSKPEGKPRAKAGRRAKANGSAKPASQTGQQAFVFEGLPTRSEKAKAGSSKRMATVANASTLRAAPRSAASRVNYVQQELDLGS
jgi:hypothetical protein